MTRYYVEYKEFVGDTDCKSIYLYARKLSDIHEIMDEYDLVVVDQTD